MEQQEQPELILILNESDSFSNTAQPIMYNPETGEFTRKGLDCVKYNARGVGTVWYKQRPYGAARLAYEHYYGYTPDIVKLIDGNQKNLSISNLVGLNRTEHNRNNHALMKTKGIKAGRKKTQVNNKEE